jgi:hypothetical protein
LAIENLSIPPHEAKAALVDLAEGLTPGGLAVRKMAAAIETVMDKPLRGLFAPATRLTVEAFCHPPHGFQFQCHR